MKKLIAILVSIILTLPNPAYGLRPVAERRNPHSGMIESLSDVVYLDLSPRCNPHNATFTKMALSFSGRILNQLIGMVRAGREPNLSEATAMGLNRTSAELLLERLLEEECNSLFIDPDVSTRTLSLFLKGGRGTLYSRALIKGENRVLVIRTCDVLEKAINEITFLQQDNKTYKLFESHEGIETLEIFFEGLGVEQQALADKCRSLLTNMCLINKSPEGTDVVYEGYRNNRTAVFARKILVAMCFGRDCKDINGDKVLMLADCITSVRSERRGKNVLLLLKSKADSTGVRIIDLVAECPNQKALIEFFGYLDELIEQENDNGLDVFLKLLAVNAKDRKQLVLHELTPDEIAALATLRAETDKCPDFQQGDTMQLPGGRPRIAVQGDSGKYVLTDPEPVIYKPKLEDITALMQAVCLLMNTGEFQASTDGNRSLFCNLPPASLKALGELFFMDEINYDIGRATPMTSRGVSDNMLALFYPEEVSGFFFDDKTPGAELVGEAVNTHVPGHDDISSHIFSSAEEFLQAHKIAITGPLSASGRNLYGQLADGSGKIVVIKAINVSIHYNSLRSSTCEDEQRELYREAHQLSWVNRIKNRYGFESDYPEIVSAENGTPIKYLFRLRRIGHFTQATGGHGCFLSPDSTDCLCICHITSADEMVYLDDHNQEYFPEEHLRRSVRDLARFARRGTFIDRWAGYGHNSDNMYDWTHSEGAGNMPQWLRASWYTNYRERGPADLGHTIILRRFYNLNDFCKCRQRLGDIIFSAVLVEAANMWKHYDYPYKFFYPDERKRFTAFVKGTFYDFYRQYTGTDPKDMLDAVIDWEHLSSRLMYELGTVIRQDLAPPYVHYDLGVDHGAFPCPELIRALYITVTFAMIEKSIQDKVRREKPQFPKSSPYAFVNAGVLLQAA